jgi:hypothetical protein
MSFFTYHDIRSQLSFAQTNLKIGSESLEFNKSIPVQEKSLDASMALGDYHCEHGCLNMNISTRLRRFFLPAVTVFVFVALGGLIAWSCGTVNGTPASSWEVNLMGRALHNNSTSSSKSHASSHRPASQLTLFSHDLLNSHLIISPISIVPNVAWIALGSACLVAISVYFFFIRPCLNKRGWSLTNLRSSTRRRVEDILVVPSR